MRKLVMATFFFSALGSLPLSSADKVEAPLALNLSCSFRELDRNGAALCTVFIANVYGMHPYLIPAFAFPFRLPHRPDSVLQFEVTRGTTKHFLPVTKSARRGRYDAPKISSDDFILLYPGAVYGWQVDLNGIDWEFPVEAGTYSLRAEFRSDLPPAHPPASAAVMAALVGHATSEDWPMNENLTSNDVSFVIRP